MDHHGEIEETIQINRTISLPDIDSKEYIFLSTNLASSCRPVLRSNRGPIACKTSQLVYILIALLKTHMPETWYNLRPDIVLDIYEQLTVRRRFPIIYAFSALNAPIIPYTILDDTNVETIFNPDNGIKIFTIGLVNTKNNNKSDINYRDGVINHYFIIIFKDGHYYSVSSYGSDYVAIPQIIVKLDVQEFGKVINAFNDETLANRQQIIHDFLQSYWLTLTSGKSVYYEDEETNKGRTIMPEEGVEREIDDYIHDSNKYKFFYFYDFETLVNENLKQVMETTNLNTFERSKKRQRAGSKLTKKNKYKSKKYNKKRSNKNKRSKTNKNNKKKT